MNLLEIIALIAGIVGLGVAAYQFSRRSSKTDTIPMTNNVGVVKDHIPMHEDSNYDKVCTFKVEATGVEYNNGDIEVKIIEIIDFRKNTVLEIKYALRYCTAKFKCVKKSSVSWSKAKPNFVINSNDLKELLKNGEIDGEGFSLNLDKDYTYEEIINLML